MSFPPRPPLAMPGMPPMPPGMLPPGYSIPPMPPMMPIGVMPAPADFCIQIMPPGMTLGHIPDVRAMANHRPPMPKKPLPPPPLPGRKSLLDDEVKIIPKGPTITVFVGNITDRASDNMIKHILQKCGSVVSWKRVQGASGKLQGRKAAFGFCEYADPESGLRAIRLLHDWEIGDKKLVVKVDAKTKTQLDEYKANKKAKKDDGSSVPVVIVNDEDVDENTQEGDKISKTSIEAILKEHEHELSRPLVSESPKKKLSKAQEALLKMSGQSNLDEMDLEEDKKSLIHREIGKFRDTMKALSLSWCYQPSICSTLAHTCLFLSRNW